MPQYDIPIREADEISQGFVLRQPFGALVSAGAFESGTGVPQSKTQAQAHGD